MDIHDKGLSRKNHFSLFCPGTSGTGRIDLDSSNTLAFAI
jgi:hypothetical protein